MRFQLPLFAPRYMLLYGVMGATVLLALLLVFNPGLWPYLILPLLLVAWLSAQACTM